MLARIIYSNAGPLRKRQHLDFSSVNDEKSLVSAAFRTERERAQMEYIILANMLNGFRKRLYKENIRIRHVNIHI